MPTFLNSNNNNPSRKLLNKGLSHMIKSIISTANEMIDDRDKGRHKRQCTCAAKNHVMSKAVRQRDTASLCKTVLQPCKKKNMERHWIVKIWAIIRIEFKSIGKYL